jgi:DNA-binding response OmpR family regulator
VRTLVVEDEKRIASFVRKGLEAQGLVVEVSHHGDEGYTLGTTRPYDVIVLDIMLPGRDGLSILRNLRDRKVPLPVILLTARSELNERLEGLNLGADDYLTEPFFIEELIARIHAVTRRAAGATQGILTVSIGWALVWGSWSGLVAALVLALFLDAKARREERWLQRQFPDYADYERKVRRFIPGVYWVQGPLSGA